MNHSNRSHAIVIGGSMTGMLAGRVLADHYEKVTIVERDQFPADPGFRKGVPQAPHIHVLLVRGQQILNELFPGLDRALAEAGAPTVNWGMESINVPGGVCLPRFESDMITRTCSRNLLEWHVRRRVAEFANITMREKCRVEGLVLDSAEKSVVGIQVYPGDEAGDGKTTAEVWEADLIVDASGRHSQTPKWIQEYGYEIPQETIVNSFLGYATQWYRVPEGFEADWKAILISGRPPDNPRYGGIYPIENNQWIVTLAGIGGIYPPTDDQEAYLEFARQLVSPLIYQALSQAEPISSIYGFRNTANRWRHYEKLERWPINYVVMGDAFCSFNPAYGQGMTVSALSAVAIDHHHRIHKAVNAPRLQKDLAQASKNVWRLATGEDLRWPTTEADARELGVVTRFAHQYVEKVRLVYQSNPDAARIFFEIAHLIRPPTQLFHPILLGGVVQQTLSDLAGRKSDEIQ